MGWLVLAGRTCQVQRMPTNPLVAHPELNGLALAFALGLLVGVQRGWVTRKAADGSRFAGVRTFGLIGFAGGFAGAFRAQEPVFSALILITGGGLVLLGYWRSARDPSHVSVTSSLVSLLTFACGFLAGAGETVIATVVSGLMVMVLAMRSQTHGWIAALTEKEVIAIARFALIALVVLPLLPDTPFGPYGAWRARQLWLVVVLVSGFSFSGYLAAKYFGATNAVLATAAAGSLVSSTAVTAALAGSIKAGEGDPAIQNAGIALASVVMFARVLVLTAALAPFAFVTLALIAAPGLLISLGGMAFALRKARAVKVKGSGHVKLRNPFDLGPAILLAGLVMALTLAARWTLDRFGDSGLVVVLAITGTVDVDSAIITLGNLPPGALAPRLAALVLVPPIVLNTLLKAGLAITIPGGGKGRAAAITLGMSAFASAVAAGLVLAS